MREDVINLARNMHEEYENLSLKYGWQTQKKTRVDFLELPEANKKVILGMALYILKRFND